MRPSSASLSKTIFRLQPVYEGQSSTTRHAYTSCVPVTYIVADEMVKGWLAWKQRGVDMAKHLARRSREHFLARIIGRGGMT